MADLSQFSDDELRDAHAVTQAIDQGKGSPDLSQFSDQQLKTAQRVTQVIDQAQAPPPAPPSEPLGHKLIREGLPIVGQYGGALLAGAAATPETAGVATIPAAMAGGAVGSAAGGEAAGWLNHKIYGDEAPTYDSLDDLKRVGTNMAIGATAELGGQLVSKGVGRIASRVAQGAEAPTAQMVSKEVETGLLDSSGKPLLKTVQEAAPVTPPVPKTDGLLSKLADKALTYVGAKVAGPIGAVVAPQIRPALTATANGLSQILQKTPQAFGKYAPALTAAAARGEISLAASAYVLQQRDPEFRQRMQEINNNQGLSQGDQ